MKKLALILSIVSILGVSAQTKYAGCDIVMTTEGSSAMTWENDSIKFTFSPTDYFWKVEIENKTDGKALINWDEVVFIRNKKSSKIIFDNTSRIRMNDPLGETAIYSKSSIEKEIFPVDNWWETGPYPVFVKKSLNKEGDMTVRIIFPVLFSDVKVDHEFTFLISPTKK